MAEVVPSSCLVFEDLYMFLQKLDQESLRFKHKICAHYEGSELRTKQQKFIPETLGILIVCHIY